MTVTPAISVIVAVYKAETYIRRCIECLLLQTFTDFEIIFVDDGSPDNSGLICEEYAAKDSRIHVFHKDNGGVSSARQYGTERAKGEYIIHSDPDDWVESTMLQELYLKAKKENSDMVICDFFVDRGNHSVLITQKPTALDSYTVLCEMFEFLTSSCWNKLVKRSCYDSIYFPENINFGEDLVVNVSLLRKSLKISYLPKSFYHYVQGVNENSMTKVVGENSIKQSILLYDILYDILKDDSCLIELMKLRICPVIVKKAFLSNIYSSKAFSDLYGVYKKYIIRSKFIPLPDRLIFYISCVGGYRLMFYVRKYLINFRYFLNGKCC